MALGFGVLRCGGDAEQPPPERPPAPGAIHGTATQRRTDFEASDQEIDALVEGNTMFALDMYSRSSAANPTGNVALAPYSISQALAMLYAGARGTTAEEMETALHWGSLQENVHEAFNRLDLTLASRQSSNLVLRIANQVWGELGLSPLPSFLDTLTQYYDAPFAELDFRESETARSTINEWVAEATAQRIPELFRSLPPSTSLLLANAMYLDAQWQVQFDRRSTAPRGFMLPDGRLVDVETMQYEGELPYGSQEGYVKVELPYGAGDLSMLVIVPDDISAFEAALTPSVLSSILAVPGYGRIQLTLPKFSFSFRGSLVEMMRAAGVRAIFDDADLSGMAEGRRLFLGAVEHEVFVEVDEEGTRAVAATGADIVGPPSGPQRIQVDRPFLFLVRDRPTGTLLFVGRVSDPRM